jgi:hypothetical protein
VTSPDACEVIERLATFPQGTGAELRVSTARCGTTAVVLFRVWRVALGQCWYPTDSAWTVPAAKAGALAAILKAKLEDGSMGPILGP